MCEKASAILADIDNSVSVTCIDFYGLHLGDEVCANVITHCATKNKACLGQLACVNFGGNALTNSFARVMSESLSGVTTIHTLGLAKNEFDDDGAESISSLIKTLPNLQVLSLSFNHIGDSGLLSLSKAWKSMHCLKTIWFQKNTITDASIDVLCESVQTLSNLESLRLTDNDAISAAAMEKLASNLGSCQKLHYLDVTNIRINKSSQDHIRHCLRVAQSRHSPTLKPPVAISSPPSRPLSGVGLDFNAATISVHGHVKDWTAKDVHRWAVGLDLPAPILVALEGIPGELLEDFIKPESLNQFDLKVIHQKLLVHAVEALVHSK